MKSEEAMRFLSMERRVKQIKSEDMSQRLGRKSHYVSHYEMRVKAVGSAEFDKLEKYANALGYEFILVPLEE